MMRVGRFVPVAVNYGQARMVSTGPQHPTVNGAQASRPFAESGPKSQQEGQRSFKGMPSDAAMIFVSTAVSFGLMYHSQVEMPSEHSY